MDSIQVIKNFPSSIDKVFQAWKSLESISKWLCPIGLKLEVDDWSVEVGKNFSFAIIDEDESYAFSGVFKEVIENKLLSFTYEWEEDIKYSTLVTIEFESQDNQTKLTLTHSGLESDEMDGHKEGWSSAFENLSNFLNH